MVSAVDQTHADSIENIIKSDKFFEGQYRDKVIKIYS